MEVRACLCDRNRLGEREALISKFQIKPKFGRCFMDFNSDSERYLCSLHGPTKNGSNEEYCLGSSWGNFYCMLSIKVSKRLQLAILYLKKVQYLEV